MIGWQGYVYSLNEFLASAKTIVLDMKSCQKANVAAND
jgi:hypothetical protein